MRKQPYQPTVEEALERYRAAFRAVTHGPMHWNGIKLSISGGDEYIAAFEALQQARARENAQKPADG